VLMELLYPMDLWIINYPEVASTRHKLLGLLRVVLWLHCCTVQGLQDSIGEKGGRLIHQSSVLVVFQPPN